MNRFVMKLVTFASLAGSLALVPAGVAFAQDAQPQGQQPQRRHHGAKREGLFGRALKLDSLTPAQRTQIEQLAGQRKAMEVPVRQADAQVLTVLAQQVEAAKVDEAALAPSLGVKRGAEVAARQVDVASLNQLHAILTPAQRGQLVDAIDARMAGRGEKRGGKEGMGGKKLGLTDQQKAEVKANLQASRGANAKPKAPGNRKAALDSFRGDAFDASALAGGARAEGREERLTKAMIPVLTPNQRATLATQLRKRAARESRS